MKPFKVHLESLRTKKKEFFYLHSVIAIDFLSAKNIKLKCGDL